VTVTLTSARYEVDSDPAAFSAYAVEKGWGDGLPLIPPTPEAVERFVLASGLPPDAVIARVPPQWGECTVERLAVNAVMAGAPAGAMPLLISSVSAICDPDFELTALNVTTAPVVPALIVNGPIRHELGISFGASCTGGADGSNASVGRALRLVLRNIGGLRAGVTSQSVFGHPGRVAGMVFGEWEERSPWAPLAERRGVPGDAVTTFGAMGTMNIIDLESETADELLHQIGRSIAIPGANAFFAGIAFSEILVATNPVFAEIIGRAYPDVKDVEQRIWESAWLPVSAWPPYSQRTLEDAGRVSKDGRVHIMREGDVRILFMVCGGLGGHHSLALHDFGSSSAATRPIERGVIPS
jgi:hypothetical protein